MDVLLRAGGLISMSDKRANFSCMPPVFLDGMLVSSNTPMTGLTERTGPVRYDIDSLHWQDIEAIEIYAGPAQVPPQYGGAHSACGVILFWTRK
jgi:hypothetical protein